MKADVVRKLLRTECRRLGGETEFAKMAGVSRQLVYAVLNGEREPRGKIQDLLGLEVEISYRRKVSPDKSHNRMIGLT